MQALTTTQGTAMLETALCDLHHRSTTWRTEAELNADDDWDDGPFRDCTGNTELRCMVCGESDE